MKTIIIEDEETETVKCLSCGEIYEQPIEDEETGGLESCPNCGGCSPIFMGICPACHKQGWGFGQLCPKCKVEYGILFIFGDLTEDERARGVKTFNVDRCKGCGCRVEMWQTKQSIWREAIQPHKDDRYGWLMGGIYCIDCFEKLLGRELKREEVILEEDCE